MYLVIGGGHMGGGILFSSSSYTEATDFFRQRIKEHPEEMTGVFVLGSSSALHWHFGAPYTDRNREQEF